MKQEDEYEWWIRKYLEGDSHDNLKVLPQH